MTTARLRNPVLPVALSGFVVLAACKSRTEPEPVASRITIFSGDNQVAPAGSPLTRPLTVRVLDDRDRAVYGVTIRWTVDEKGGMVGGATTPSVTDASYRCTIHSESFTEGMVGTVTAQ